MLTAILGKIVHQEDPGAVEVDFRVQQPLAVLCRHSEGLGGTKRLLVELDRGIGVADDQVRRDGLGGFGHFNLLDCGSVDRWLERRCDVHAPLPSRRTRVPSADRRPEIFGQALTPPQQQSGNNRSCPQSALRPNRDKFAISPSRTSHRWRRTRSPRALYAAPAPAPGSRGCGWSPTPVVPGLSDRMFSATRRSRWRCGNRMQTPCRAPTGPPARSCGSRDPLLLPMPPSSP